MKRENRFCSKGLLRLWVTCNDYERNRCFHPIPTFRRESMQMRRLSRCGIGNHVRYEMKRHDSAVTITVVTISKA